MKDTPDLVNEFLSYATNDRNRSVHTLSRYRAVLSDVFPAYGDPATIDTADAEQWWKSRYHMAPATRANELACLRAFFKWTTRFDHRAEDPTRRLDPPAVPNQLPRMIGRTELDRLLGELTEDAPDLRRAIALGTFGGLRVSEAASLDWEDIDLEQRRAYVRGKGQKQRPVAVSVKMLDYILPDTGGNVVTGTTTAYSGAVLQRKLNRLMESNGIALRYHSLRKRGASLALANGASIIAVQTMFGWSSANTAMKYAVVGDKELDRIAAAMQ